MAPFKITELDHIVLNVSDIERSLSFYTQILGLKGERIEEFKSGKVGFPSVRINDGTIIDLFPTKRPLALSGGEKNSANLTIFAWSSGARISPASPNILRRIRLRSAKDRCRAGARAAGRRRFIFSIPTGMKLRFAATDPTEGQFDA